MTLIVRIKPKLAQLDCYYVSISLDLTSYSVGYPSFSVFQFNLIPFDLDRVPYSTVHFPATLALLDPRIPNINYCLNSLLLNRLPWV